MKTTISILLTAFFGLFLSTQNVKAQSCIICNSNTVGDSSSAIGAGNISTGLYSLATGFQNEAIGNYSVAMPFMAKAIGERSLSFGYNSKAFGPGSIALGTYSNTNENAPLSVAIGSFISTDTNNSIVIGFGLMDNPLRNNIEKSLMIGFNSNIPTLFVKQSDGFGKTGRIGIGNITNPEAKLHIKADDGEDASLFLQPSGTYNWGKLMFGDEDHLIQSRTGQSMEFYTEPNENFKFINGSIFIQDSFEGLILKSPDGQCWKGTIDNDGSFNFESVDCSLLTENDNSQGVSQNVARIYPNPAGSKLFVEIPDGMQQSYVSIYNEQGVLLQSCDVQAGRNSISLKKMSAGVMIVKVYDDSGKLLSTEKILHQ